METDPIQLAIARSAGYTTLSRLFSTPCEKTFLLVTGGEARRRVAGALEALGGATDIEEPPGIPDLAAFHSEHVRTFGLAPSEDAPPLESHYGAPNVFRQSEILADIAGFYRAFGLKPALGIGERLDHVATELEFLGILACKTGYARSSGDEEGEALAAGAERKFVEGHLLPWVPAFVHRLALRSPRSPYVTFGRWLERLLVEDARALGIPPSDRDPAEIKVTGFEAAEPLACGGGCADGGFEIPT